jgi:CheY-like chemotaxis protein
MSSGHLTSVTNIERLPILLVDDELAVLRSLKRQISSWGYAVVAVTTPSAALEACRTQTPCLIITDLLMPEMDGFELARKLHEEHGEATPPLAVLTGDTQRPDLHQHLDVVITILLKPTPPEYLREFVDRLCSTHRRPPYILPDDEEPPAVA